MSLGSDYAAGYGLGLNTSSSYYGGGGGGGGGNASDLYKSMLAARPRGGGGGVIVGKSAQEIAVQAAKDALMLKEKEIANKKAEQDMRQAELDAIAQRELQKAQTKQTEEETFQKEREGLTFYDKRAEAKRGIVTEEAAKTKSERLQGVLAGIKSGNFQPVMDYFKIYGREGVQFDNIEADRFGGITATYNGKESHYTSPQDFIDRVMQPAEGILRQKEERELALKEKTGAAEAEKNIGMGEFYRTGKGEAEKAAAKREATIRANKVTLAKQAESAYKTAVATATEQGAPIPDKNEFLVDFIETGMKAIEEAGTGGIDTTGERTVLGTGTTDAGDEIIAYSDGTYTINGQSAHYDSETKEIVLDSESKKKEGDKYGAAGVVKPAGHEQFNPIGSKK